MKPAEITKLKLANKDFILGFENIKHEVNLGSLSMGEVDDSIKKLNDERNAKIDAVVASTQEKLDLAIRQVNATIAAVKSGTIPWEHLLGGGLALAGATGYGVDRVRTKRRKNKGEPV